MAKGDHDNAQANITQNQTRANDQYDLYRGDLQKTNPGAEGNAERANIITGYNGLTGNNGIANQGAVNNIRNIEGNVPSIDLGSSAAYQGYSGLAGNGGWSDANTGSVNEDVSGLKSIGATGGWRDQDLGNVQGAINNLNTVGGPQGYGNFALTGGFSPDDIRNFRARSNSVIPSYYAAQDQAIARNNAISGGGNTAANTAARLSLSRQAAQQAGQQSINTEASLADQIRQGKLAGLAGQAGVYGNVAQAGQNMGQSLASNKLYGLTGAGNLTTGMVNSQNQAKEAALAGMAALEKANLDAASGARSGNLSAEGNILNTSNQGTEAALSGLTGLYGTNYAPYVFNQTSNLNALNAQTNANNGFANSYINTANIPGDFQTGLGYASDVAGGASGLITGLTGDVSSLKKVF